MLASSQLKEQNERSEKSQDASNRTIHQLNQHLNQTLVGALCTGVFTRHRNPLLLANHSK